MEQRKLLKMPDKIANWCGVCSGMAYCFGCSTIIIRMLFLIFTIFISGSGLIVYFICWAVMDEWDEVPGDYYDITG